MYPGQFIKKDNLIDTKQRPYREPSPQSPFLSWTNAEQVHYDPI
jgi:hypothetical protein